MNSNPQPEKYNPLKNEIFIPIPLKIAQRKDLKNLSKLVYGYLSKCFGRDGLVCPTMKQIANDLNVSRQMVSKCITELSTKGLIEIEKTGKASRYNFIDVNNVATSKPDVNNVATSKPDVNNVATSKPDVNTVATSKPDVNTVATSDVNTVVTSKPDVNTVVTSDVNTVVTSLLLKDKGKEKIKYSAAPPDSFIHPELDSILEKIPYKKFKRSSLNACLIEQGEAYINYLLRISESADHPEWYFRGGILGYYRGYLDSPEYAAADFKLRGGDYDN